MLNKERREKGLLELTYEDLYQKSSQIEENLQETTQRVVEKHKELESAHG